MKTTIEELINAKKCKRGKKMKRKGTYKTKIMKPEQKQPEPEKVNTFLEECDDLIARAKKILEEIKKEEHESAS